jgi:hypothetical protein
VIHAKKTTENNGSDLMVYYRNSCGLPDQGLSFQDRIKELNIKIVEEYYV